MLSSVLLKVMRIYNELEEDFPSTAAYDDYLEDIEHTVYSLTFDVNRSETEVCCFHSFKQ